MLLRCYDPNIAYGRPQADRGEIIEAAKAANAHKYIMSFPAGYDTEVGDRGVKLSDGEKQKNGVKLIVLDKGQLVEMGTPDCSLRERPGKPECMEERGQWMKSSSRIPS